MGDTFRYLATAISQAEKKYSLWLISQLYVILSRVRYLKDLFFVGNKVQTLNTIRQLLSKRNMAEERLYNFFTSLKNSENNRDGPNEIATPQFLRSHFSVPPTENGFVYVMVSVAKFRSRIYFVSQTEKSLSEELRRLNSTTEGISQYTQINQPWAVGFFIWDFVDAEDREEVFNIVHSIDKNHDSLYYNSFKQKCKHDLKNYTHLKMINCGNIINIDDNCWSFRFLCGVLIYLIFLIYELLCVGRTAKRKGLFLCH